MSICPLGLVVCLSVAPRNNRLSGTLPDGLAGSAKDNVHVSWYLQGNRLSGTWPAAFDIITKLNVVRMDHNELSGRLPDGFAAFRDMSLTRMNHNNLFGRIPEVVALMLKLSHLVLECNKLSGTIPRGIAHIAGLVMLGHNRLSGGIPHSIAKKVLVNDNQLAGSIPPLRNVILVSYSKNYFEGSLPEVTSPSLHPSGPLNHDWRYYSCDTPL